MAKRRTLPGRRRGTFTLGDLSDAVHAISPRSLAAPWDNVGLIIGDRSEPIARAALAIDLTQPVLEEVTARSRLRTAVIAYHPPIFEPLKRITADDPRSALILRATRALAGVISPHTALDAVAGGMSDWLAEGVGAGSLAPIEPALAQPTQEATLIATKLPRTFVDRVREAMSLAGAGRIGRYTQCSFELAGHGTFLGDATTSPRVGARARFERVEESRLEMVSSSAALPMVLSALRAAHPYEEPPIELIALAPRPSVREGQGRVLTLLKPASTAEIVRRLARHLRVPTREMEVVTARAGADSTHRHIGLCPGSGGSLLPRAVDLGCTLFITGELKHHDQLDAAARGCSVILAGHTQTERGFLPHYRARLMRAIPGLPIEIARSDRPPSVRHA